MQVQLRNSESTENILHCFQEVCSLLSSFTTLPNEARHLQPRRWLPWYPPWHFPFRTENLTKKNPLHAEFKKLSLQMIISLVSWLHITYRNEPYQYIYKCLWLQMEGQISSGLTCSWGTVAFLHHSSSLMMNMMHTQLNVQQTQMSTSPTSGRTNRRVPTINTPQQQWCVSEGKGSDEEISVLLTGSANRGSEVCHICQSQVCKKEKQNGNNDP